jgi:hypothetical protein
MKLEEQVPTLELSKRLAELLGDKAPESLFMWGLAGMMGWQVENKLYAHTRWRNAKIYPAYTVGELYSLLHNNGICDILLNKVAPNLLANYLAKMLCRKLENK